MTVRILLLCTDAEDTGIVLKCLLGMNYRIYACGPDRQRKPIERFHQVKAYYPLPFDLANGEPQPTIEGLLQLVDRHRIEVVVPTGFDSVKFLSRHRSQLSPRARLFPLPDHEIIEPLDNKLLFRDFCHRHRLPHPQTLLAQHREELLAHHPVLEFPLLIKPLSASAGRGIERFESFEQLAASAATNDPSVYPLLLQELIDGYDVAFNGLALDGELRAWTVQRFINIPYQDFQLRWSQFQNIPEVYAMCRELVRICRYSGPINIDLRFDQRTGEYTYIEVNPRLWANTFYSRLDGVSFVDVGIRLTLGERLWVAPKNSGRIWGTPQKLPGLLLRHRDLFFLKALPRHTLYQLRCFFWDKYYFRLLEALAK